MKMQKALDIINGHLMQKRGYMVSFYHKDGRILSSDYFPDKHAGEDLIPTEREAWNLARAFANRTTGRCINIYVVDESFRPVPGYSTHMIANRP